MPNLSRAKENTVVFKSNNTSNNAYYYWRPYRYHQEITIPADSEWYRLCHSLFARTTYFASDTSNDLLDSR